MEVLQRVELGVRRTWKTALVYVAIFLGCGALLVFVESRLQHYVEDTFYADPADGRARGEVQRYYDNRWPGRVEVTGCSFWEPDGQSVYDGYDCRAHVVGTTCTALIRFEVPRAGTVLGRMDMDPSPMRRHHIVPSCA